MRALLDVNVLISLLDQAHPHHQSAMSWLKAQIRHGWASCPITQNGCMRIMSQASYPGARSVSQIAERLRGALEQEVTDEAVRAFIVEKLAALAEHMRNQ